MDPQKILAKAEAWKRKSHHLSLTLRLRSVSEAKRFLREHSVVLWNEKGDLPNLLDATMGRIANGRERVKGKAAENCDHLRTQVLQDPEFLDCRFFCRQDTALHERLWPFATVISRVNYSHVKDSARISREAKRILSFLEREGPTAPNRLKEALKLSGGPEARTFHRANLELFDELLVLPKPLAHEKGAIQLDLWEHCMPKPVRSRAEQLSEKEAALQLISATLQSSVLSVEKNIPRWFTWLDKDLKELIDQLIEKKHFLRVIYRKKSYIISKKILA
jgi:hypothetical protein